MYREQYSQPRMSQPPDMLTNKDSAYLSDALSWELLAAKKAYHMSLECQDNQIRRQLEQLSDMHQTHYEILLNHFRPQQQYDAQQSYTTNYQQ